VSRSRTALLSLLLCGCGSIPVVFPGDGGIPGSRACSAQNPCAAPLVCEASGECVECIIDANCSGATPACDAATKRCVTCKASLGCTLPYVCSPSAPVCVLPCVMDSSECPGFIDGCRANVCSTCNEDDDCGPALFCDVPHGRCVACLTDANCSAPTPKCHQATGTCGECVKNTDCGSGGVCFQGSCRAPH
jgi:hypothetical protein